MDGDIEELSAIDSTPIEILIKAEATECLQNRLNTLPNKQKEAIILHYFHDLKVKDIAQITGVPLATAKSRIKQGLDKLRKLYKGDD